jgi:acetylglutamate/LysW-gamma-L-alpha-aminoadipate kinase
MVAAALQADLLVLLTAVPGLMEHFPDERSLIRSLPKARLPQALEMAHGRMKKKILGAEEALAGGVKRVIIADGRVTNPIASAFAGNGTEIS